MSYNYATEKPLLFTEVGQVRFLQIRDKAKNLLDTAGAFRMQELGATSWEDMACVDRLKELKEIEELPRNCWGQFRVFTTPQTHNY